MLTQEHIDWYKRDILRAQKKTSQEIGLAMRLAAESGCRGCSYCRSAARHIRILEETLTELLFLVNSLRAGSQSKKKFPKKMFPGNAFYRGFINDAGEYVNMFTMGHSEYRKNYILAYGEERAYRMITIQAEGMRSQVLFSDRKYAPTEAQYATLRELMIDAEGLLCFSFLYDTKHPTT
jgi:hypothetical protein